MFVCITPCIIAFKISMHAFMLYPISIYQPKISRPSFYIGKPFFNPWAEILAFYDCRYKIVYVLVFIVVPYKYTSNAMIAQ